MPRKRVEVTVEQRDRYLELRRSGATKRAAAAGAGISEAVLYGELMKDEAFKARDAECFDESWEPVEELVYKIAIGETRCTDQSLRAAIFGLKARRKWQDRVQVEMRSVGYEPYVGVDGESGEEARLSDVGDGVLKLVSGGDGE